MLCIAHHTGTQTDTHTASLPSCSILPIEQVLKKKRKKLKLFFLFYSAKDDSDDAVKHSTTMNINECIQLCREMHLNVPDRVISRLFACVQGDEDDDDDETSMLEEKGELTYTEFAEFMSAVASW